MPVDGEMRAVGGLACRPAAADLRPSRAVYIASALGFGLDSCGPPESVKVDSGLPSGGFLPVGNVRERLGEKCTKDDEVEGGDVRPDGAVLAASLQNAPEGVSDFGS